MGGGISRRWRYERLTCSHLGMGNCVLRYRLLAKRGGSRSELPALILRNTRTSIRLVKATRLDQARTGAKAPSCESFVLKC